MPQNQTKSYRPKLSLVLPCLNEAQVLPEVISRIEEAFHDFSEADYEVLFVDDGSTDDTPQILKAAAARDSRIRILNFTRNFGHPAAISAGLDHASGDAVAILDCDLQDPPELIIDMFRKWNEGYDIVYGIRKFI